MSPGQRTLKDAYNNAFSVESTTWTWHFIADVLSG